MTVEAKIMQSQGGLPATERTHISRTSREARIVALKNITKHSIKYQNQVPNESATYIPTYVVPSVRVE